MTRLLFLALLLLLPASAAAEGILPANDAWSRAKGGKLIIIDVRSPGEWRATGIPKGARAITYHDPGGEASVVARIAAAVKGDKDARIAVICAAGGRSSRVQAWLRRAGFRNVTNILEGMNGRGASMPGWLSRGLPTQKWTPK